MSKLVQTNTVDKLLLQGYYARGDGDLALLHIHGFEGNFYENKFVHVIADALEKDKTTFLTVNTRGCEKIKDLNTTDGDTITISARYELLEDSPKDIDSWIEFLLNDGIKRIVLQGHSLGTLKVIRYLYEGKYKDNIEKVILLAPFDKNGLMNAYSKTPIPELLKKAQIQIDNGLGDEIITKEFDAIQVSYKTYVSWYKQDVLGRMFEFCSPTYDFPALSRIGIPTKVIVGSKDEYFHATNPDNFSEALDIFKKHIPNCETVLIDGANHGYLGYEDVLASEIRKFIK